MYLSPCKHTLCFCAPGPPDLLTLPRRSNSSSYTAFSCPISRRKHNRREFKVFSGILLLSCTIDTQKRGKEHSMNTQLSYPFSPVPGTHMFDKPVILVVEDDFSLSDLLCDALSVKYPQFCIVSASSEQVLVLATVTRPFLLLNIRRIPLVTKSYQIL